MTLVKRIKLTKLIDNTPEEIKVEGYEEVLVKLPTIGDRLKVKEELVKLPSFKLLSDQEKMTFEGYLIAMKALVKPIVTVEEFLNSPDIKVMELLETVWDWYNDELKGLNDKREIRLKRFLQRKKANSQ